MWKEKEIIMLPSKDKSGTLWINTSGQLLHTHVSGEYKEKYKPQNLYILSDEEIKEANIWYIDIIDNIIHKSLSAIPKGTMFYNSAKKIIATTDTSLETSDEQFHDTFKQHLPQIPESFISLFIEEYDKGNVVKKVKVEYECLEEPTIDGDWEKYTEYQLKVDSNNFINIRKIKDSWNREEIITIINEVAMLIDSDEISNDIELYEWIEDTVFCNACRTTLVKQATIVYTEKEMESLCKSAFAQGEKNGNNIIYYQYFDDWFEQNKKK